MNEKQAIDIIVALVSIVAGVIIFYFSLQAGKQLGDNCVDNSIENSLTALMAASAGIATLGLAYFGCMYSASNCYSGVIRSSKTSTIYFSIAAVISMVLIGSASVILSNKNIDNCGGETLKRDIGIVMGLSIAIFLASLLGVFVSQKIIWGRKKTSDDAQVDSDYLGDFGEDFGGMVSGRNNKYNPKRKNRRY